MLSHDISGFRQFFTPLVFEVLGATLLQGFYPNFWCCNMTRIAKAPTNMSGGTMYNGSIVTILEPPFPNLQTKALLV